MAKVISIPIGPIFTGGACRGLVHVIQKGDTLYELGKKYHVSVTQLMFANPFVDVYNLQIGDELCIPAVIQPRQAETLPQRREEGMEGEMPSRMWMGMPESREEEGMAPRMGAGMPTGSMEEGMPSRMGTGMSSRDAGMPTGSMEEGMAPRMGTGMSFRDAGMSTGSMEEGMAPRMGTGMPTASMDGRMHHGAIDRTSPSQEAEEMPSEMREERMALDRMREEGLAEMRDGRVPEDRYPRFPIERESSMPDMVSGEGEME